MQHNNSNTKTDRVCYAFANGNCMRGASCRFQHPVSNDHPLVHSKIEIVTDSSTILMKKWKDFVVHCKKSRYDVYIGRSSAGMPAGASGVWGNPFPMKDSSDDERDRVTAQYEEWIRAQPELIEKARKELCGKVLACWCAPKKCHGYVLAEIANTDYSDVNNTHCTKLSEKIISDSQESISHHIISDTLGEEGFVDIGINITNSQIHSKWKSIIQRAIQSNVQTVLLTGTSIKCSNTSIQLAHEWLRETGVSNLRCTVGVHPHEAKTFDETTCQTMRNLIRDPSVCAVGECGLDFNRNFSTRDEQVHAFRQQIQIAIEVNLPLFLHERDAHTVLLEILDEFPPHTLPPIVIHCFTGTISEAETYLHREYYIGLTGTICKFERGKTLRELVTSILPLDRIMLETDAPFMSFVKERRHSEPCDVALVAEQIAKCKGIHVDEVRRVTSSTTRRFFRL